jgi:DEAD/DEAH box helicase domain-containing protein
MLVVSDNSPLRYLRVLNCTHVLPVLFERICIPRAVAEELQHPSTPAVVRAWLADPPAWLEIRPIAGRPNTTLATLEVGVLVLDDTAPGNEATQHLHWRRWLHLYNTSQTLTGVLLATAEGLQHHDYETITLAVTPAAGMQPTDAASRAWASVLDKVLPEVKAGLQKLMEADVPPPDEVGYEHANDSGDVDAEAEVAWCAVQVVVLTEAQAEYASIWQAQGWTTVLAREAWEVTVREKLKTAGAPR